MQLKLQDRGQQKTLVFSGDLGNSDSVLMRPPHRLQQADLLLMESTYGNRNHRPMDETLSQFEAILKSTWEAGGNVLIPSFAVGRTQEILFHLGSLYHDNKLDNWQVFLDSPMAINVTDTYNHWLQLLDPSDVKQLSDCHRHCLEKFLPTLNLSVTPEQSIAINRIKSGAIIIAGSGMCTGGRITHHFKHRIWQRNNTVIFVGFQARGTLGRSLVDGAKNIKLFGETYRVQANIETLGGFSAHAGQSQLIDWVKEFSPPPRLLLVHGEPKAMDALADKLWEDELHCEIPSPQSSVQF